MASAHLDELPAEAELAAMLQPEVAGCYQCGKCSAGCPVGGVMDILPQQVVQLVRVGKTEELFRTETLWLCLGCGTCRSRCPNGIDIGRVIDLLRQCQPASVGRSTVKDIRRFHQLFVGEIWQRGRVYELGLLVRYKMLTAKVWEDLPLALRIMRRQKLRWLPSRVGTWRKIRGQIFRRR